MKKTAIFVLCAAMLFCMFGCTKGSDDLGKQTTINKKEGYTLAQEVLTFKYSDDEDTLTEADGAKVSGFVVTKDNSTGKAQNKTDAINIAKQEISVDFNKINVYFDRTHGMWKVVFSIDTEVAAGDGTTSTENKIQETVYVHEDGYTVASVIGR
jgi:hypothetical protein